MPVLSQWLLAREAGNRATAVENPPAGVEIESTIVLKAFGAKPKSDKEVKPGVGKAWHQSTSLHSGVDGTDSKLLDMERG